MNKGKKDSSIKENNKPSFAYDNKNKVNKLDKSIKRETKLNDYKMRYNECPALTIQPEFYLCVIAREGKPPLITKLGKNIEDSKPICDSCKKTFEVKAIKTENVKLKKKIEAIPINLLPYCKEGGKLFDNNTRMSCPKLLGERRPIEAKHRKKSDKIVPCDSAEGNRQCQSGKICEYLIYIEEKKHPQYQEQFLEKHR